MEKLRTNKKGFTLVEIIVVLIIMGILLAIAVPSVMGYVSKAEDQRDLATAHTGFVGAQTVVLKQRADLKVAANTPQADKDNILATNITNTTVSAEIAPTTVHAINCIVSNEVVTQCSIQLENGGEWANFVANGTAEMSANATVTAPNVAAPK